MSFKLKIEHDCKIIHYTHSGTIGTVAIGEAWEELLKLKEFTELKYNLLSDYSGAILDMEVDDTAKIADFLVSLKDIIADKKQAFIVNDPNNIGLTLLFEAEVYSKVGFNVRPFSTKDDAIAWLCS